MLGNSESFSTSVFLYVMVGGMSLDLEVVGNPANVFLFELSYCVLIPIRECYLVIDEGVLVAMKLRMSVAGSGRLGGRLS